MGEAPPSAGPSREISTRIRPSGDVAAARDGASRPADDPEAVITNPNPKARGNSRRRIVDLRGTRQEGRRARGDPGEGSARAHGPRSRRGLARFEGPSSPKSSIKSPSCRVYCSGRPRSSRPRRMDRCEAAMDERARRQAAESPTTSRSSRTPRPPAARRGPLRSRRSPPVRRPTPPDDPATHRRTRGNRCRSKGWCRSKGATPFFRPAPFVPPRAGGAARPERRRIRPRALTVLRLSDRPAGRAGLGLRVHSGRCRRRPTDGRRGRLPRRRRPVRKVTRRRVRPGVTPVARRRPCFTGNGEPLYASWASTRPESAR